MLGMVQTDQNRHLLGANANTPYFEHLMAPPSWASTGHISARPWLAGSQGKVESKRTYYMMISCHPPGLAALARYCSMGSICRGAC